MSAYFEFRDELFWGSNASIHGILEALVREIESGTVSLA